MTKNECAPKPFSTEEILGEKIKLLEEQIKMKDIIMSYQEEKIKNLETKINSLEEEEIHGDDQKYFHDFPSDKSILCCIKFKGKEYYLGSHQYHANDNIDSNRNKVNGHPRWSNGQTWKFYEIYKGKYVISYVESVWNMQNWKLYSDGNELILSKDKSSLFELLKVENKENEKCFYIRDYSSKRFLYLTFNYGDSSSFFIGLSDKINQEEIGRFIFYYC